MSSTLTLKRTVKNICKKYRILPLKRLGQNFLIDKSALKKIISAANPKKDDIILEIGPGTGILTRELAKRAKKVVAVEKDPKLVRILNDELRTMNIRNVEVIRGDILKILNSKFLIRNSYNKVVANLPFYLTAPVIRKFLEGKVLPCQAVLMVQKEVAQRICARPPRMSLLAVSVQSYGKPKIISYIPKTSFWPRPKVDSAILRITPYCKITAMAVILQQERNLFFRIVRAGFSQPRKQLLNNLSTMLKLDKEKTKSWLLKNNIRPEQRAETLSVENWMNLAKSFNPLFFFCIYGL